MTWYLIDDGSDVPSDVEADSPAEAIQSYLATLGESENYTIREIWSGAATTQSMAAIAVSETVARRYAGTHRFPPPDETIATSYFAVEPIDDGP